ncbi:hypothetical protein RB195_017264 [Necator americanus]
MAEMYWAIQINKMLKAPSMSRQTRVIQRRVNIVLVLQTACSALFLQLPPLAQYIMMFTGIDSGNVMANHLLLSCWWSFNTLYSRIPTKFPFLQRKI